MSDKKSIAQELEDKAKAAAKTVEDFADKVTADEEPVVIIPNPDASAPAPTSGGKP